MAKDPGSPRRIIRYEAAGGVVYGKDRVLLLNRPRLREVRLPKGHLERGEGREQAALREITEETGYDELAVRADLGSRLVEFDTQGGHVARTEHYFLVELLGEHTLARPAADEQFAPFWVSWDEAAALLSFEAEREWMHRARAAWQKLFGPQDSRSP